MPELNVNYLINLKPEKAIAYLKSKGYKFSFNWKEVWQEAHTKAFTVAKAMDLDILSTIRNSVEDALTNGKTLQQFKNDLTPELQKKGWWGRKDVVDPNTGEVKNVQLGSPHRLKTIYETNLNVAYKTGQFKEQMDNAADRPYWMYEATLDANTRPSHAALHGKVFRYDDPIWNKIYPPNDWNCRCTVRPLTQAQVKAKGLPIEPSGTDIPKGFQPPEWAYNPAKESLSFSKPLGTDFKTSANNKTFRDAGRLPAKEIPNDQRAPSPEKFPSVKEVGEKKYLELLYKELGLEDRDQSSIPTVDKDLAVFSRENLKHFYEKQDGRERYASYLKPTLQNPFEVYLTEYTNGKSFEYRKVYIGLFHDTQKREDVFIVLRKEKDSTVFWNAFERKTPQVDKLRKGVLVYAKAGA